MEIAWYGHSCFKLSERGKATIVTDPFNDAIGYALPKLKADVVTASHDAPGHSSYETVKGTRRIVDRPGEYEIGGVFIAGVALHNLEVDPPKRNIAYIFDFDGLSVAHLGDLDHIPPQSLMEMLGTVHVALVPVGGGRGLNATQAVELINLIEPNIVIPMHFKATEHGLAHLDPLERFLKEMGMSRIHQEQTFKITASGLPEQTQIVVLEIAS
ncbi:MAG TPA: MBL fold metallo-hydrolase [Aggregatilineales bacterium]|nr:MBL fold metallo-hydrolase [Anaerolineales bacterium]HRE46330.1 MBL fold metallo-hydrolase [Aggregatilineales bacterium]